MFNLAKRGGENDCSICMNPMEESEQIVELNCSKLHIFHKECLCQWVEIGRSECPLCREDILKIKE